MKRVRLTHMDGKLPNLALMKLAHWHRAEGDHVTLTRTPQPSLFESGYDLVYGSAIFDWSEPEVQQLIRAYPGAVVGGTGTQVNQTVEERLKLTQYEHYDYSIYPDYPFSIGFTQRGCRLSCGFCVVPRKEGRPKPVNTILDIWRPETSRCVVLLDNDFFGQPNQEWQARVQELREGNFKVNFSQGINVRLITPEAALALAGLRYYDSKFVKRRLYTAWDNLGQEKVFFRGLETLQQAGIPARHIMVYMLVGYDPKETMERVLYRFNRLKEAGCLPYPMVYDNSNKTLKAFQRWAVRRYDEIVTWDEYKPTSRKPEPHATGPLVELSHWLS